MMTAKYILESDGMGGVEPIIFRSSTNHSSMAMRLGLENKDIVGAGSFSIDNNWLSLTLGSVSLGIKGGDYDQAFECLVQTLFADDASEMINRKNEDREQLKRKKSENL